MGRIRRPKRKFYTVGAGSAAFRWLWAQDQNDDRLADTGIVHPEPEATLYQWIQRGTELVNGEDGNDYVDLSVDQIMTRNGNNPTFYALMRENVARTFVGSNLYYVEALITALPESANIGIGVINFSGVSSEADIRLGYASIYYADGTLISNPGASSNGTITTWTGTFKEGDRIGMVYDQVLDDIVLFVNGSEVARLEYTNTGTNMYPAFVLFGEGASIDTSGASYKPDGTSYY